MVGLVLTSQGAMQLSCFSTQIRICTHFSCLSWDTAAQKCFGWPHPSHAGRTHWRVIQLLCLLHAHQQTAACRHRVARVDLDLLSRFEVESAPTRFAEAWVTHVGQDDILALRHGVVGEGCMPASDVKDGSPTCGGGEGDMVWQHGRGKRFVASRILSTPCSC